jgi:hypothetical protein
MAGLPALEVLSAMLALRPSRAMDSLDHSPRRTVGVSQKVIRRRRLEPPEPARSAEPLKRPWRLADPNAV